MIEIALFLLATAFVYCAYRFIEMLREARRLDRLAMSNKAREEERRLRMKEAKRRRLADMERDTKILNDRAVLSNREDLLNFTRGTE